MKDYNSITTNNENLFHVIQMRPLCSSIELKDAIKGVSKKYILLYLFETGEIEWDKHGIDRLLKVAEDTQAKLIYSDYNENGNNTKASHPLIDYQIGSVRDDFDFGKAILMNTASIRSVLSMLNYNYRFAGFYSIRLFLGDGKGIVHLNESLYTYHIRSTQDNNSHFAYVDPKNREVQKEMELAFSQFLKANGCYIPYSNLKRENFDSASFPREASVIIPVRNREKTIADAINSALSQKTDFKFNVIVVDNHSTDKTSSIIHSFVQKTSQVIHILPDTGNYGIGGCWNLAVTTPECGKFAVQLDSDDLYNSPNTLQKIVNTFYKEQCAMVVGSYKLTNFDLDEIPPGIIDHREWTAENGHNNLLRVNGIGAPRAFYTKIIRENLLPNVSYGEDYAVALRISREYRIGRIFEPLYNCRRWEGNSDAHLTQEKLNLFNNYKDRLRSYEILARINKKP